MKTNYRNLFRVKEAHHCMLIVIGMILVQSSFSQPQYMTNFTTSTSPSQIPFNSTTYNKVQWLFKPSDFGNVPSGNITKIYLRNAQSMLPVLININGLTIKMGETTLSQLPPGPWITANMNTVYYASVFSAAPLPNNWVEIVLQTPFYFDNTKNFILEASHSGFTVGFGVMQATMNYRSLYGSTSSSLAQSQNYLLDFGFVLANSTQVTDAGLRKIVSPSDTVCMNTPYPVTVLLKNFGNTILTSVQIKWQINGQVQTAYTWSGLLQPSDSAAVTIGTYMFSATSFNNWIKAWTSYPNFSTDANPSNDTIKKTNILAIPNPNATISPSGNHTICQGDSLLLTVNGGINYSYQWYKNSTPIGANQAQLSIKQAGTYTVKVTHPAGCWTMSNPVVLTVQNLPNVNLGPDITIKKSHSITLDAGSGFSSYLWNTGATTQTITVSGNAYPPGIQTFHVTVTNNHGCKNSDTINVTIIDDTGIEDLDSHQTIVVYPNPSNGNFSLLSNLPLHIEKLMLFNLAGKLVGNYPELPSNKEIFVSFIDLPDGMYILKLITPEGLICQKICIRR